MTASERKTLSPRSLPAVIENNSDVISMLPQLSRANFGITHAPNVTYGRFVAPEVTKYYFDERQANAPASSSAADRPLGPNTRPANSAERRLRIRWLERRTFGRGQSNRRGRPAVKLFNVFTSPPFTSTWNHSRRY